MYIWVPRETVPHHTPYVLKQAHVNLLSPGAKFWKSSKVIKAIKEEEYRHLDSSKKVSKNPSIYVSSSSDSESNKPLVRTRKRSSDSQVKLDVRVSSLEHLVGSIQKSVENMQGRKRSKVDSTSVLGLFSCIICKDLALANDPLVPQCCSGIVACKECLVGWIEQNPTCPQCRGSISIDICLPIPPYRPLPSLAGVKEDDYASSD